MILLVNLWSFISMILVFCFSGGILSSIVTQGIKTINTFDEMIDSNLTIVSGNWTNIFFSIQYKKDKKLIDLYPKINFEVDNTVCF